MVAAFKTGGTKNQASNTEPPAVTGSVISVGRFGSRFANILRFFDLQQLGSVSRFGHSNAADAPAQEPFSILLLTVIISFL